MWISTTGVSCAKAASVALLLVFLPACFSVEAPTRLDSPEYRAALPSGKYVIVAGDELEIRFFHTPELDVTLPVRPDGYISLPYAREVRVAGRTPERVARELTKRLAKELKEPRIAVIVRSFSAHQIHVGGRVEEPGVFPLTGPMTVLDSLFAAGGFQKQALLSNVVVIRQRPDKKFQVIPIDIDAVLDGSDVTQNIRLLPYDAVYVPNSAVANVNDWVELYIRENLPFNVSIRPDLVF